MKNCEGGVILPFLLSLITCGACLFSCGEFDLTLAPIFPGGGVILNYTDFKGGEWNIWRDCID